MKFSSNPNTKCTKKPQCSISTNPFSDVPSQKYLNPQIRTNKLVNSIFLPPLSFKISLRGYILSYFFKLLRVLYLQNVCWIFSALYIPTCVGKIFQVVVFTFLENALNLYIFTHAPLPHSKHQVEKSVSPKTEGVEKAIICSTISKFDQKIWRWLGTFVYLDFAWFVIFLNVKALQFCK